MLTIQASSTGKSKLIRSSVAKMTECSTCPKLLPTSAHKRDFEKPQPIKVKHLLEQYENLKSAKKDSVRKKIQPERLGTYSSTKKTRINGKQNGTSTCTQPGLPVKRVQRYLNFNIMSDDTSKANTENKIQTNEFVSDKSGSKKVPEYPKRKSLLLPPNSIKDKHLQECSKKTNNCSKIFEVSDEILDEENIDTAVEKDATVAKADNLLSSSLHNKCLNATVNFAVPFNSRMVSNELETIRFSNYSSSKLNYRNSVKNLEVAHSARKCQSSSQCTSPKQVVISNENQLHVQNDSTCVNILNSTNERRTSIQRVSNCMQDLCNNLQVTKLVASEGDTDIQHESPEMIYVRKDKIIRLEHDLKVVLNEAEKNLHKLRLASTCVTELLSADGKKDSIFHNDAKNHTDIEAANNRMVDKETQIKTCCGTTECSDEQLKTPITHVPTIKITEVQGPVENEGNNKENENLNVRMSGSIDGSFLELENQLNIVHAKPTEDYYTEPKTPTVAKYKQKRSFREYMALKSSIRFLETPDGKKVRSLCHVDSTDKSARHVTYISNKLLTDLHNLYSDSPDS